MIKYQLLWSEEAPYPTIPKLYVSTRILNKSLNNMCFSVDAICTSRSRLDNDSPRASTSKYNTVTNKLQSCAITHLRRTIRTRALKRWWARRKLRVIYVPGALNYTIRWEREYVRRSMSRIIVIPNTIELDSAIFEPASNTGSTIAWYSQRLIHPTMHQISSIFMSHCLRQNATWWKPTKSSRSPTKIAPRSLRKL